MAKRNPNLRAFVKVDKLGQVVAGTLILRYTPPESGRSYFWQEIIPDICFTTTTTTTTTTSTTTTTTAT